LCKIIAAKNKPSNARVRGFVGNIASAGAPIVNQNVQCRWAESLALAECRTIQNNSNKKQAVQCHPAETEASSRHIAIAQVPISKSGRSAPLGRPEPLRVLLELHPKNGGTTTALGGGEGWRIPVVPLRQAAGLGFSSRLCPASWLEDLKIARFLDYS